MNVLSSLLLAVPLGLNHVNLLPMHGGSMTSMSSSHSLKSLMSVHCLVEDQRTAVGGGGGLDIRLFMCWDSFLIISGYLIKYITDLGDYVIDAI